MPVSFPYSQQLLNIHSIHSFPHTWAVMLGVYYNFIRIETIIFCGNFNKSKNDQIWSIDLFVVLCLQKFFFRKISVRTLLFFCSFNYLSSWIVCKTATTVPTPAAKYFIIFSALVRSGSKTTIFS
jgi:hypothetical protein